MAVTPEQATVYESMGAIAESALADVLPDYLAITDDEIAAWGQNRRQYWLRVVAMALDAEERRLSLKHPGRRQETNIVESFRNLTYRLETHPCP